MVAVVTLGQPELLAEGWRHPQEGGVRAVEAAAEHKLPGAPLVFPMAVHPQQREPLVKVALVARVGMPAVVAVAEAGMAVVAEVVMITTAAQMAVVAEEDPHMPAQTTPAM